MVHRLLVFFVAVLFTFNAAAELATQKSSTNGVTVAVTPANLSPGAKTWDFSIVLDTHSQDLSDDLVQSAVLADDRGNEFKPLAWEGVAPGGHHRSGVLKFDAVDPGARAVELRISRPGEARARIFGWQLR